MGHLQRLRWLRDSTRRQRPNLQVHDQPPPTCCSILTINSDRNITSAYVGVKVPILYVLSNVASSISKFNRDIQDERGSKQSQISCSSGYYNSIYCELTCKPECGQVDLTYWSRKSSLTLCCPAQNVSSKSGNSVANSVALGKDEENGVAASEIPPPWWNQYTFNEALKNKLCKIV